MSDKSANLIAESFRIYLFEIIPANADSTQIRECRRAFYAGAAAMFNALCVSGPENYDPQLEIRNFLELVRQGVL